MNSIWRSVRASFQRLAALFGKPRRDAGFAAELESHLQLHIEDNLRAGMSPEAARCSALLKLGGIEQTKENYRDQRGLPFLESFLQDLRFSLRMLRKNPGFTSVAVLTLALGIGANTAIFTLVHAIMLKPLPVSHPEQLYNLGDDSDCCSLQGSQDSFTLFSYPLYQEIRDHTPEFSDIAAFNSGRHNVSVRSSNDGSIAEPFTGEFVSGNYFRMFDVGAFAGRTLAPSDDQPGSPVVAVMSYRTWQVHFASDRSLVGATLIIDRLPVTVVGVAPPGFFGDTLQSDPPAFWFPLGAEPILSSIRTHLGEADNYWLYAIGRLRPGTQPGQVQAHLTAEIQHWISARPRLSGYTPGELQKLRLVLTPGYTGTVNFVSYIGGLEFLMVVSGFVLLIACANIANLLLARAAASRLQIAVRFALGASRARLTCQMLTEGLLLAFMGGVAGVLLAVLGTRGILLLAFRGAEYVPIDPTPSVPVLAFTFALSALTSLIFSSIPAWVATRTQPLEPLRGAGRSTTDRSTLPQKSLLALQATLSLVLLVSAGLATETLRHLEHQNFGFQTRGRLMVKLSTDLAGYTPERIASICRELQERLTHIPGVLSASLSNYSPMERANWSDLISIAGRPSLQGDDASSSFVSISAHYFETIGTHLLRGRFIDEGDTPSSQHVAVVNETFARKYFPNADAVGQHFGIGDASHAEDYAIVGIVEDTKYQDARVPAYTTAFLSLLQAKENNANIFHSIQLLVSGSPQNLQPTVQRTLASVDPNLTIIHAITFEEQVSRNFNSDRLVARLTTLYGMLALILACVGLYGVAAYTVTRRTSEIGIRMTLGASRPAIIRMMLRVAMSPAALGLLIGLPIALACGRAIASGLYGVKSYDPIVFCTAVLVLAISSFAATVIPAWRASRVDPMTALRCE